MTITPEMIYEDVNRITSDLIKLSLCNKQSFPCISAQDNNIREVSISGNKSLSVVLKNLPYRDVYNELIRSKIYNIKMLDGALLQFMYRFKDDALIAHRLAFFPSPDLEEFQNSPEIYEMDEMYAEVISKGVVVFPFRFDFDVRDDVVRDVEHPMSHLTLGQYLNCRIPVSSPVTPSEFIRFVLRNFYHTAHNQFCEKIRISNMTFTDTITANERDIAHLIIS
jgi:hypothetical protein